MTDNFKIIYQILSYLEKNMDNQHCDISKIDNEQFGITYERWAKYIAMLLNAGYITGARVFENINGDTRVENKNISLTLKGLEYLSENAIMQRLYKKAKGIVDLIP